MAHEGAVRLPTTLKAAYRTELFRAFHSPYETPIVVLINGVLMGVLWWWTPADSLFSVHSLWAFPLVLASWMYSDVPATNVFGSDAKRMIAAFDDVPAMRRMLYAKNLVLMTLVVPIATTVAIVVAIYLHRPIVAFVNIGWIIVVPVSVLGVSAWFGIYFPYHPIEIKTRWEHRKPFFHMIVRWLAAAMVPYGLVPLLGAIVMIPTIILWNQAGVDPNKSESDLLYFLGVAIACVLAVVLWWWGHKMAVKLALRRRDKLVAYLSDPMNG